MLKTEIAKPTQKKTERTKGVLKPHHIYYVCGPGEASIHVSGYLAPEKLKESILSSNQ
jgi:hypothetical protein